MRLLDSETATLVVVDIQEAFRTAIPDFEMIAMRAATAVRGFRLLGVPVIVTEQYPKGLGRTAEEIVFSLPDDHSPLEKTKFSAVSDDLVAKLNKCRATQVVIAGIEAHICVNQTAHELLEQGFDVHLLTDAAGSRFAADRDAGFKKMFASGVVPATVEMALFELMRDAKRPKFKEIQNLVK